ncbi:ATPase RavA domain-containing protein [Photobacterium profundum]|uniref:ATPase RavA domain-containing protein n=1 Tax=Photobacterium profundum TaxID=74109 RepID=UPI0002F7459D|nr:ATPase RavA domain-containing protein [Photobacterium profundum]
MKQASGKVTDAEHNIKLSRISFHGALPHNFVEKEIPTLIECSISEASESVSELKSVIEKSAFRISQLSEFYS